MLADGDFGGARTKCDAILDSDPTNGRAYFFILMCDLRCRNRAELLALSNPFDNNSNFLRVMQYGDPVLKNELQGYINSINARNEAIKLKEEQDKIREEEENNAKLKNPKVGDEFYFGINRGRGQRIRWKVLSVRDHMALIICKFSVESSRYHNGNYPTWADCSLRKWLNNDFIQGSFTPAEQSRILPCKNINNDKNPKFNTRGGVTTTDKVFLLSINEAIQFFADDQARAIGYNWWLRSPGANPNAAAIVNPGGFISSTGVHNVNEVRPALWLNINI